MSQNYEFDVINEVAELDFVVAVSPMAASELGYLDDETIHPNVSSGEGKDPFRKRFQRDSEAPDEEYPAVYQLALTAPEETELSFDEMMTEIEEVVSEHSVQAAIGAVDSGVPKDDFSGWDIDPVVDILCVRR